MPAFVGLADSWTSDVWGAGNLGNAYEPLKGAELSGRLAMPAGIDVPRLQDRRDLRRQFDRLGRELERAAERAGGRSLHRNGLRHGRLGQGADRRSNVTREPDATRDAYGRCSIGEKALLARRLVESGVTFVLVSGAWGYFDHHGDEVRWGGIAKGLTPILPTVDRAMHALVNDLETRGLLDSTLVLMMGEFGRSPVMTKTAGRGHWTSVMSMLVAGGGLPCGQVIGSTDRRDTA